MWQSGVILLLCLGVIEIKCGAIPAYIKPCSRTKDFKSCAIEHGNEALPHFLKGDAALKIPNLLPLKFPLVDVNPGPNLKIKLTDIEVFGLETTTLTNLEMDFEKHTGLIEVEIKYVTIIATYNVDGQIMVLPVQGNGPINITAVNADFKYRFPYKLEKKKDIEYALLLPDDSLEFKVEKAYFKLDNLFNGNKLMGDNVNKFLNENDQDVLKELGGAITGTVRAVVKQVAGAVLEQVPYHDLFLD